jgi:outer membrane protein assembly factor BamB
MTYRHKILPAAILAMAALSLAACSHGHFKNPFVSTSHSKYTGKGERIPVIVYDQGITPAEALKGVSFYIPDPQPIADWPVPGGTPSQSVENVAAGKDFAVAWRSKFGVGSGRAFHVTAPPIGADGKIFVMDGAADVSAYDAATGRQIWRKDLSVKTRRSKEGFGGGLAYADGRVFVSSGYRFVAAVDASDGRLIWRTPVDVPIHAAPTVADGRVYAESVDDNLMTFDAATGTPGWAYQALVEPARILEATSPAVTADAVVTSFASGELVALQPANGNGLWSAVLSKSTRNSALSEIRDIPGRPVIFKGDVFAISHSGLFAAIDLRTGDVRWSLPLTGETTPWPAGDVVYATDTSGVVVCASRDSGQIYWTVDLNKSAKKPKDRAVWSGPTLASNRLVLVSSKGQAVALDAKTGAMLKTMKIGSDALMNPIAMGPNLYIATQGADLIALR